MADEVEEQGWIRQSQHGDHEAFEMLVRRHQRMIHALTFRMTGSLADSADLAQDTFIQAYRQISGFRGEARFSSWLYRIALNLCLNWRAKYRRRELAHAVLRDNADLAAAPGDDARARLVQEALMRLKPEQRAALVLTIYEGLNHAEAARVLGCAETTISWRVFAARNRLKKILKPLAPGSTAHE